MYVYYCWITALMPSYQDGIIAGMVKRGYMVGPAAKDGKVTVSDNNAAALIAISVYRTDEETNVNKIYDDVVAVLKETKAYYYSVIISHSYEATWVGANFNLPLKAKGVVEKASTATPPPLPGGKKNVN